MLRFVAGILFAFGAIVLVAAPQPYYSIAAGVVAAYLLWSSRAFLHTSFRQRHMHVVHGSAHDECEKLNHGHRAHHVR
jgi:hypothetical protein